MGRPIENRSDAWALPIMQRPNTKNFKGRYIRSNRRLSSNRTEVPRRVGLRMPGTSAPNPRPDRESRRRPELTQVNVTRPGVANDYPSEVEPERIDHNSGWHEGNGKAKWATLML